MKIDGIPHVKRRHWDSMILPKLQLLIKKNGLYTNAFVMKLVKELNEIFC